MRQKRAAQARELRTVVVVRWEFERDGHVGSLLDLARGAWRFVWVDFEAGIGGSETCFQLSSNVDREAAGTEVRAHTL